MNNIPNTSQNGRHAYVNSQLNDLELDRVDMSESMEIISDPITRNGIWVISSILLILFIGSFFFQYPDTIQGRFEIITKSPPVVIKALKNGLVNHQIFKDGDTVREGDLLFIFEDAGNYKEIIALEQLINQPILPILDSITLQKFTNLGTVQASYSDFLNAVENLLNYQASSNLDKQLLPLASRLGFLDNLYTVNQNLLVVKEKEAELKRKILSRDSSLFKSKVIPELTYETSNAEFLEFLGQAQSIQQEATNTQIQISSLEQEISNLMIADEENRQKLEAQVNQQKIKLLGEIRVWKKNNLILSPISGTLNKSPLLETNNYLAKGQFMAKVSPQQASDKIGTVIYPTTNAGKVTPNQSIILKFDAYPYQEFGIIYEELDRISTIPDSVHVGFFQVQDSLITNSGYPILFSQGMKGEAEIITDDISLIARIVHPLRSLFY